MSSEIESRREPDTVASIAARPSRFVAIVSTWTTFIPRREEDRTRFRTDPWLVPHVTSPRGTKPRGPIHSPIAKSPSFIHAGMTGTRIFAGRATNSTSWGRPRSAGPQSRRWISTASCVCKLDSFGLKRAGCLDSPGSCSRWSVSRHSRSGAPSRKLRSPAWPGHPPPGEATRSVEFTRTSAHPLWTERVQSAIKKGTMSHDRRECLARALAVPPTPR